MAEEYNQIRLNIVLILWCLSCLLKSSLAISYVNPQTQKLAGNLHTIRGNEVFSLVWIIKISPTCDIKKILYDVKDCQSKSLNVLKSQRKLILLKKYKPFLNMYVIAHPYYIIFNKYKKHLRNVYNKLIKHKMSLNHTDFMNKELYNFNINDELIFNEIEECILQFFTSHLCVQEAHQEILRERKKRSFINFTDPLYKNQWHLNNTNPGEYDINVIGAWESGLSGQGVTVCVIDDGLEWRHPDLNNNYDSQGSYDLNADDDDPSPVYNADGSAHGTRCGGEIAAVANGVCGIGVAFGASLSGVRVLGVDRLTDALEAHAFLYALHINDIYSCSWGPNDDGRTVEGPHTLARRALRLGTMRGRQGRGAIYVVASGNGGQRHDNCNWDGYANSVYTLTIGAVDARGRLPAYAELCAAMMAVAPSSGRGHRAIVTTNWRGGPVSQSKSGMARTPQLRSKGGSECTHSHSGSSAAAPLVAGAVALALQVNPCLSWRDVHYLVALTARMINSDHSLWTLNGAGLWHSDAFGFGLIDATGLTTAAAVWQSVPFRTTFRSAWVVNNLSIPSKTKRGLGKKNETWLSVRHELGADRATALALNTIETIQIYVSATLLCRGRLVVEVICPSGTQSVLAAPRPKDNSTSGIKDWAFSTVRCWGESSVGKYTIRFRQEGPQTSKGTLLGTRVAVHGSMLTEKQFQDRRKLVSRALSGEWMGENTVKCRMPPKQFPTFAPISQYTFKILCLVGILAMCLAIYNTIEFSCCYDDAKRKHTLRLKQLKRMKRLQMQLKKNALKHKDNNETQSLLGFSESLTHNDISQSIVPSGTWCEADVSASSAPHSASNSCSSASPPSSPSSNCSYSDSSSNISIAKIPNEEILTATTDVESTSVY